MGKLTRRSFRPSLGSRPNSGVFEKSSRPSSGVFSSRPSSAVFEAAEVGKDEASEASSKDNSDLAQELKVPIPQFERFLCQLLRYNNQALADQAEQHKQHNLDNFVQILNQLDGLPYMLEHLGQIPDIVTLNQQLGRQSQKIADLEARLATSEQNHQREQESHNATKDEVAHLKSVGISKDERLHHLKNLINTVDTDVQAAKLALETKDSELHALRAEVSKLNSLVAFQDQEHAQLNTTIDTKDAEITSLSESLATTEHELSNTKKILAQLDAQIESKTQELCSLRSSHDIAFQKLEETQTENLEALSERQDQAVESLTRQIVELKQLIRLQSHLEPAGITPPLSPGWGIPKLGFFGAGKTKASGNGHKRSQSNVVEQRAKVDVPIATML